MTTTNTTTKRSELASEVEYWLYLLLILSEKSEHLVLEVLLRESHYQHRLLFSIRAFFLHGGFGGFSMSRSLRNQISFCNDMSKTGRILVMIQRHSGPETTWTGTCSNKVQVGDIVVSINGVAVPLILRRDDAAGGYKLVSPALMYLARSKEERKIVKGTLRGKPFNVTPDEGFIEEEFALV